jgi:glycosyltransferase involved in cell wall biosynthesis
MKKKIFFVATTPFVVNPFLSAHLMTLARSYRVVLCVNLDAYPLSPALHTHIDVIHVAFERKIDPIRDLMSLLHLWWIFIRESPSAVHSITPKAGLLAMIAAFFSGVRFRFHTFTGQVWANSQGFPRKIFKAIDRLIIRLASQTFADSPSQCRFLESEGVARNGEVTVLGRGSICGVDQNRFRPDAELRARKRYEMDLGEGICVFLFVGRITHDKGVFDLVEACQMLHRSGLPAELWVVGPDEDHLLTGLKLLAEQAGCKIRWFDPTPEPERYMAAADVLVLPSYREGFGTVIIEAAACGLPAVAYKINGVVDAVVENETGILVEARNIEALAAAMQLMAGDQTLRLKLGARALSRVTSEFSSQAVTAAWEAHYRQVLGGNTG